MIRSLLLAAALFSLSIPVVGGTIVTVTCKVYLPAEVESDPSSASCDQWGVVSPIPPAEVAFASGSVSQGSINGSASATPWQDSPALASFYASFDETFTVPTTITWNYSVGTIADSFVTLDLGGLTENCPGYDVACFGPIVQSLAPGTYTFSMYMEAFGSGFASGTLTESSQVPEPGTLGLAASILLYFAVRGWRGRSRTQAR